MPIFSDYSTLIYDAVPLAVADDAARFVIDCPSPFYGIYGALKLGAGRGINYHGELASNHMENIAVEKLALSIPPCDFNFISDADFMVFDCEGAFTSLKTMKMGPGEYPLLMVGIGMGVAAAEFYKSDKTYGSFVIAAEAGYTGKVGIGMGVAYGSFVIAAKAGYTGKVGIGMGVAASEFYKPDKTYHMYFNATKAVYTGKVGIGMGVAASEFYKPGKTYDLYFIAAKAGYTGKHLCWQHSNHEETCSALDLMMNKLRDGNDLIQMHENFGTHDGQFQEGEGGPEDNGFVHDMSLDGVADDPMQIDAVEDYPNYATHSVQVYFNQNSMGLIDTTGIDSPDQLKGAAILIAHLPAGQYIFKYVRYGQEIRMDNDDFHHFLEDLTDIHIWDGELVTVS